MRGAMAPSRGKRRSSSAPMKGTLSGRRDRAIHDEARDSAGDGRPKGTRMGDDKPDGIDSAVCARDVAMQEALGVEPILIQG